MSASHRKLARLPLEIFDNLHLCQISSSSSSSSSSNQPSTTTTTTSPQDLRSQICNRLKRFPIVVQSARGTTTTTTASIKTVGDLLRVSKRTLLLALDPLLTFRELEIWIQRICKVCSAKTMSAWSLLESTHEDLPIVDTQSSSFGDCMRYLPTGLPSLDAKLQGGIRVGSVTEIVGRAGAGKTQLAFQLCLLAAKYNQGSMYIDTERKISLERLAEMSQHRYHHQDSTTSTNDGGDMLFSYNDGIHANAQQQQQPANQHSPNSSNGNHHRYFAFKSPDEVLANLMVKTPSSTEELIQTLDAAEETILQRNHAIIASNNSSSSDTTKRLLYPVRVLIVDSIAAPLKRDFGSDAFLPRSTAIFTCAQILRRLAETLHLAVVVINQVGAVVDNSSNNNQNYTSPYSVKAALGTSWHHCVSTRLVLDQYDSQPEQQEQYNNGQDTGGWMDFGNLSTRRRTVDIAKSNIVPHATTQFEICNAGIVDPQKQ